MTYDWLIQPGGIRRKIDKPPPRQLVSCRPLLVQALQFPIIIPILLINRFALFKKQFNHTLPRIVPSNTIL